MSESYRLVAASPQDGRAVFDLLQALGQGENGFTNAAYGLRFEAFGAYLRKLEREAAGVDLEPGHVPQTVYWLWRDETPVGVIKLRHRLNDALRRHGGHIGYSVRPGERGKGLGTLMLKLVLLEAKKLGLERVLLTCFETNLASRHVIENNGGVLEKVEEDTCFYWITL